MNKDAILATVIGFGVGLVIAGLVFIGPSLLNGFPRISLPNFSFLTNLVKSQSKSAKPSPTPIAKNVTLTIESPLPESIEPKSETLVSGATQPNALVVLEGETAETVVVANAQGAYAGKLTLAEGKNDIRVTSYVKNKTYANMVTVYYTPEDF